MKNNVCSICYGTKNTKSIEFDPIIRPCNLGSCSKTNHHFHFICKKCEHRITKEKVKKK